MFVPQLADFNGDGIVDLISGSNCCAPYAFHVWLGKPDGLFGEIQTVQFRDQSYYEALESAKKNATSLDGWGEVMLHPLLLQRRVTFPNILDWDGDGKQDLLMGTSEILVYQNLNRFDLAKWNRDYPQEGKARWEYDFRKPNNLLFKLAASNAQLGKPTKPRQVNPTGDYTTTTVSFPFVRFRDWDGNGTTDAIAIKTVSVYPHFVKEPEKSSSKWSHSLVWFPNKNKRGAPDFDKPRVLFTVQDPNTRLDSLAVIDWDDDGKNEIIIGVAETFSGYQQPSKPRLELLGR